MAQFRSDLGSIFDGRRSEACARLGQLADFRGFWALIYRTWRGAYRSREFHEFPLPDALAALLLYYAPFGTLHCARFDIDGRPTEGLHLDIGQKHLGGFYLNPRPNRRRDSPGRACAWPSAEIRRNTRWPQQSPWEALAWRRRGL